MTQTSPKSEPTFPSQDALETRVKELSDALARSNAFIKAFVSMSHELRTPLNAILGFAELMHSGKAGPVAPHHHEYLGDILTSAQQLLLQLNDVLNRAKVESMSKEA